MAQGKKGGGGGGGGMGPMAASRPEPLDQLTQMLRLNKEQKKERQESHGRDPGGSGAPRDNMVKSREQIAAAVEGGKSQAEISIREGFRRSGAQVSTVEAKTFSKISTLDADQKANSQGLVNSISFLHEVFKRKNWNTNPSE